MNIFFISEDPVLAAQWQVDKHVVKMPLETFQMLDVNYKKGKGFYNHPCTIWARTSLGNWNWLTQHGLALCKEYTERYGKVHACQKKIEFYHENPIQFEHTEFTKPPLCMPEEYWRENYVEAYRQYYIHGKSHLASWKNPERKPYWYVIQTNLLGQ